jgi:hypothetical protein
MRLALRRKQCDATPFGQFPLLRVLGAKPKLLILNFEDPQVSVRHKQRETLIWTMGDSTYTIVLPMPKWLKLCLALTCLICVIAICIAPDVDLPDAVLLLAVVALAILSSKPSLACRTTIRSVPFEIPACLPLLLEPERKRVFLC